MFRTAFRFDLLAREFTISAETVPKLKKLSNVKPFPRRPMVMSSVWMARTLSFTRRPFSTPNHKFSVVTASSEPYNTFCKNLASGAAWMLSKPLKACSASSAVGVAKMLFCGVPAPKKMERKLPISIDPRPTLMTARTSSAPAATAWPTPVASVLPPSTKGCRPWRATSRDKGRVTGTGPKRIPRSLFAASKALPPGTPAEAHTDMAAQPC
mmetsp:Transcript_12704/g.40053  ORF Transcript_12704/g.40053 Transcript_12704/m.40053 type:complete len:211 (+) Transcript_12704:101-733(+)